MDNISNIDSVEALIQMIQEYINQLEEIKKNKIPLSITIHTDFNLPKYESSDFLKYKCLIYIHTLISRILILDKSANILLKNKLLLPPTIIFRAIIETIAIFFYFNDKFKNYIREKDKKGLNDFLTEIMYNSMPKFLESLPNPTRIGKIIKIANKAFSKMSELVPPDFELQKVYDDLSNVTHPNFHGTFGGFSELNKEDLSTLIKEDLHEGVFISCSNGISLCHIIFIINLEEFLLTLEEIFIDKKF